MTSSNLKYISLFSGIEAASVAWEPLGWEPVAFSEIEPFPCELLKQRFPDVPNLGDIAKIDWTQYAGTVDIIVGGSPCQSLSIAGNREGLRGESGLMFEYIRAVREVMPRYFVWENVPGALSSEKGGAFGQLLHEMDECGYGYSWRVLDAQFFGVAQRRRRVFLVGSLGTMRAAEILFEPDSLRWDHPSSRDKRKSLAERIKNGLGGCYFQPCAGFSYKASAGAGTIGFEDEIGPSLLASRNDAAVCFQQNQRDEVRLIGGDGQLAGALSASSGMKNASYVCMASTQANAEIDEELCGTLTQRSHKDAPVIASNGEDVVGALCAKDFKGVSSQFVSEGKVIATKSESSYIVRRLTPLECERLQGFPDGWTDIEFKGKPASDTARYKALGNSMAVPVMRWIGKRLKEQLCRTS